MTIKTSIVLLLLVSGLFIFIPGANNHACATAGGGEGGGEGGGGAGGEGEGEEEEAEIAEQTCDSQVWRAMEARSRLETEREIMQNQNLIFKADSILNYTCFDNMTAHASLNVGPLFTHTEYFGGLIIPWGAPYGMDNAMQTVVVSAMDSYVSSNFDHYYLGGRGEELGLGEPEVEPVGSRGRNYTCGVMNEVWAAAKCMNFLHTERFAEIDGFYPFIDIEAIEGQGESVAGYQTTPERRDYPTPCGGTPITGSTWEEMYRLSRNETGFGSGDPLYEYHAPLNADFTDIREFLVPGECADAIPTGINVILGPGSTDTYADGVCTNPGCTYDSGGECQAEGGEEGGEEGGGDPPIPTGDEGE